MINEPASQQQIPQASIDQIRQFLFNSFPDTAIAHSYHVEALLDPTVQNSPEFQAFSEVELNELHHQVAALGSFYRMQQGDPTAITSLAVNLAGFLENRNLAMQLAQQLPQEVRQNRSLQTMLQMVQRSAQAVQQNTPAMQQIIALSGAPEPGPMLVGPPRSSPALY